MAHWIHIGHFALLYIAFFQHLTQVSADGFFELQFVSIENPGHRLANGQCCKPNLDRDECLGPCNTQLHVCLKEFQSVPKMDSRCTFGENGSRLDGQNETAIIIPFDFTWNGLFTLIVKLTHQNVNDTLDLVAQDVQQSILHPDIEWHNISVTSGTTKLVYRIRIRCADHYYNTTCTKFCRPRHDTFGHFTCDINGDKVCAEGWMGKPNCEKAICKTGCHKTHGSCKRPGECRCQFGWQGPLCDQCVPHPGCVHGTCNSPMQCNCELNWGGLMCNLDLNYCGRHKTCQNGGTCRPTLPNQYICECPDGYAGKNCERKSLSCASQPCQHGGTCFTQVNDRYTCQCAPGRSGVNCEIDFDECTSNPCQHGGTCVDRLNGFECKCSPEWQGPFCQLDADECQGRPCLNANSCRNLIGDYVCSCLAGWTGKNCDENIDDCHGQCKHGATCIDTVAGYWCSCTRGYTGQHCDVNTDECASNPCFHGGRCEDRQDGYNCHCPRGYGGENCQIDIDMCDPNPCQNGASCYDMQDGDFYCQCTGEYEGRNCQMKKDYCSTHICQVVDSCLVLEPSQRGSGGPSFVTSNVCGSHGECISLNNYGGFTCACDRGFTGKYCHLNVNDCASQPCQNGGTCIDGVNDFRCICEPGWAGELCHINLDDCREMPCRNKGTCIDLVNDFVCSCPAEWKGKTCGLQTSHCDTNTCANGGTCVDIGLSFSCLCPSGWKGVNCNRRETKSCDSSPCQNGATCINSGDSFSCVCPDGYEGNTCAIDTNDCNPYPCYNGGKCIDGQAWYECNCTRGFIGPDCRINIKECLSNPCAYGATCIDGIGDYTCICPPGRTGIHCQTVVGDLLPKPQPCIYNNRRFAHEATWEHECNSCSCFNGKVKCTKLWCGPANCLSHVNMTEPAATCQDDETCRIYHDTTCFTPPCLPWGVCRKRGGNKSPYPSYTHAAVCEPEKANYGTSCMKLSLMFDLTRVPTGITVEAICRAIRRFPTLKPLAFDYSLTITCERTEGMEESLDITVSLLGKGSSWEEDHKVNPKLKEVVEAIAKHIGHRQSNNSALTAVTEVKIETVFYSLRPDLSYVIPTVCSLIALIGLLLIIILIIWHYKHTHAHHPARRRLSYLKQESDIFKTNNENEENIRRYRNSLFETDKGGGTGSNTSLDQKSPATELLEFSDFDLKESLNFERYQKSNADISPSSSTAMSVQSNRNDAKQNNSPVKMVKKKNVNIEISMRQMEREGIV